MQTLTTPQFSQGKLPLTGMTLTKLEDAEGNEHMFEIAGQCHPCLGTSSQSKQQLPLAVLVLLPPTCCATLFFLLLYSVWLEFLSISLLVEATSSHCP